VAQALDDATNDNTHDGKEDDGKERELPRDTYHKREVAYDKEGVAEGYLQSIRYAELHDHNILRNLRHNVTLTLVAKVAHVHIYDVREHLVSHTLHGVYTQALDGHSRSIAEEVAKEVHTHRNTAQETKELNACKLRAEEQGIYVREYVVEALLVKLYSWKGVQRLELKASIRGEHSVEDGYYHRVVEGVEHGVQRSKDKVGYSISA